MRINTNTYALAAGGAITAALAFTAINTGYYSADANPLSIDRKILMAATAAAIYVAVFTTAHALFRRAGLSHRLYYASAGAVAMLVASTVIVDPEYLRIAKNNGQLIPTLLLPFIAGWLPGSLYHWQAGHAEAQSDIDELVTRIRRPAMNEPNPAGIDPAHISTSSTEYYDGPVQVKNSINATLFAATFATFSSHVILFFFLIAGQVVVSASAVDPNSRIAVMFKRSPSGAPAPDYSVLFEALLPVVTSGVTLSLVAAIPVGIAIYLSHLGLRAFGRSDYLSYGLAGLALPPTIGLVLFFVLPLGLQLAIPFALAMMLYRRLAGLEPLAIREDVEVTDRRALVGADHARRRYARVIDRSGRG